jgi:hypothetical protein
MANNANLKKGNPETQFKAGQEQVEIARKGGKASAAKRREKKTMEQSLQILLNLAVSDSTLTDPEDNDTFNKVKGKNLTVQDKILVEVIKKALKGDLKAIEFLRDTSGQKPVDKKNVKQDVNVHNPFSELSADELRKLIDDE